MAGSFSHAYHHAAIQTEIIDKVPDAKEDLWQLIRVRNAWEMARAHLESALKRKLAATSEADDPDLPIDPETRAAIGTKVQRIHQVKFPDTEARSESIYGRINKAMCKGQASNFDLRKIRSAVFNKTIIPKKKRQLEQEMELTFQQSSEDTLSEITRTVGEGTDAHPEDAKQRSRGSPNQISAHIYHLSEPRVTTLGGECTLFATPPGQSRFGRICV